MHLYTNLPYTSTSPRSSLSSFLMEKQVQILLLVLTASHLLGAVAAFSEDWWSIDCGGSRPRAFDDTILWDIDTNYTKVGSNAEVRQNQALEEMNTLRFFPNRTANNCYIIPIKSPGYNYIVRAGFFYGNYDGLSKAPTFDLKLERENWTTVNTSSPVEGGLPIYVEAIYLTRSDNLTVCLMQTRDEEVPFISSLEGVPISSLYEEVLESSTATLHLIARTHFGGSATVRYPNDSYNRIWTRGETPPNCRANVSKPLAYHIGVENGPPVEVLLNYIESMNVSSPITLAVDLPLHYSTPLPAYFAFYFGDLTPTRNRSDIRSMQIHINGQEKSTVTYDGEFTEAEIVYPVDIMGSTINITIVPTNQSTLPPLISGLEIFTRHDLTPQLTPPTGPSTNAITKCLPSMFVILIHALCLVGLFL